MASGGHFSSQQSRNAKQSVGGSVSHAHGEPCDLLEPPWLLTANNLDLHASATEVRLSKKQRNKNKSRAVPALSSPLSSESSPRVPCQKSSASLFAHSKFSPVPRNEAGDVIGARLWQALSDYGDADSDTEESSAQKLQILQRKDLPNGTTIKKALRDSFVRVNKQDNTTKLPNTSLIVERLMHLKDCINQVTSIMQNLEKSDEPCTREQMGRLDEMLMQLRHEEQEHLELLQQVLVARNMKNTDQDVASSSCSTENVLSCPIKLKQENVGAADEGCSESEDDQPDNHNQFLQEMIESREKLTAIKEQQAALVNLQKRAEDRLAEAKAFHEHIMETALPLTDEWNASDLQNGNSSRGEFDDDSGRGRKDEDSADSGVSDPPQLPPPRKTNRSDKTVDVDSIHQRLQFLKEVGDNRKLAEILTAAEENISQDEKTAELHRRQLEDKLRKLQEKKEQMDHLLAEISSLQTFSDQNCKPRNPPLANKEHVSHNVENSSVIQGARQFQSVMNTQSDKLKKVNGMKETFKQLEEMVGNLNVVSEHECSGIHDRELQGNPRRARSQSQKVKEKGHTRKQGAVKSDNIKKENLFASFPARRHYEAEGRANEDPDTATGPAVVSGVVDDDDDEAAIQEKVQKLKVAKSKLQKLHTLLGTMQQLQQGGEPIPNELLSILSSMKKEDEDEDESTPEQAVCINRENTNDCTQNDMSRLEVVEEKMKQQRVDLEKLREERDRLLSMKEQLTQLQHQFPIKNNRQRSSGEGGSSARREKQARQKNLLLSANAHETGQDPNLFRHYLVPDRNVTPASRSASATQKTTISAVGVPEKDVNSSRTPNLLSNALNLPRSRAATYAGSSEQQLRRQCRDPGLVDFMEELDQSLSLRDELQKQKTVLEDLLRQEQKKQLGFSQNQDIRSQSGSSDKSEMIEGSSSVLAPDTTVAATWGGSSTQDNLNDEVEEQMESLDEDEGQDSGSADEDVTESRLPSFAQGNENIGLQMENSTQRQRDCQLNRTVNYRRSLLNQWRRNIQPNSSHKNDEHVPYQCAHQETLPPMEISTSDLPSGDISRLSKHLQQQLEQTNHLCQSVLRDQHNLTSVLMAHSGSCHLISNQPDFLRQYNYQLYQQQQLLLNLSHCYHMLYLQQMEIQHLQQCLQQSPDSENAELPPPVTNNQLAGNEELNFRHWCIPSWLNPTTLVSPSFFHPSFPFDAIHNPVSYAPNAYNSPNTASNQEGKTASETLNNQVSPGTRANNFLDNFRSYSRQNLLSTTPKSNERPGSVSSPRSVPHRTIHSQIMQRGSGSRSRSYSHSQTTYAVPQNAVGRSSSPNVSSVQNSGARPRVKRPNLNQEQLADDRAPTGDRARRNPACLNLLDMPEPSTTRSLPPPQSSTQSAINFSIPTNQTPRPVVMESGTDRQQTVSGEIHNLIQKQENNLDFLAELFKQLQLMCSDSQRSKLLSAVKEIAGKSSGEPSLNTRVIKAVESRAKNHPVYSTSERHSDGDGIVQIPENLASPSDVRQDDQSPVESSSSSASWTKTQVAGTMQKKTAIKQQVAPSHQSHTALPNAQQENGGCIRRRPNDLDLSTFLENHRYEECTVQLQGQLCTYVLQTLPQHPLRFFRGQLLQGLQQVLSKYQGQRIRDCESEILQDVNEVVKTELSIHKHMSRQRRERSTESDRNETSVRNSIHDVGGFSEREAAHKDSKSPRTEDNVEPHSEDGHCYQPNGENIPETLKVVSRKVYLDLQPNHPEDVRAAPDGIAAAPPPPPLSPRLMEEESGYDCDAEGETEPEVEAETEADDTQDLAEADQSAGQRSERMRENAVGASAASDGNVGGTPSLTESADPNRHHRLVNGDITYHENIVGACLDFVPGQVSAAEGDGDELMLDDIPTKLAPLSQDELQRHIAEESAANSLIQDILSDNYGTELLGDEENFRESGAL